MLEPPPQDSPCQEAPLLTNLQLRTGRKGSLGEEEEGKFPAERPSLRFRPVLALGGGSLPPPAPLGSGLLCSGPPSPTAASGWPIQAASHG